MPFDERNIPDERGHVAHVILTMGLGGAERLVHDLAIRRAEQKRRVSVICLDAIRDNLEGLAERCVPVHLIRRRPMVFDPSTARALVRHVRRHDVRVLHAHDLSSLAYAVVAGALTRIPVVMTEHSRHYLEERARRRWEKRLLSMGLDALVEVSDQLADASRCRDGVARRRIHVIPNGVPVESYRHADGAAVRREWGLEPSCLLIGAVGRLEHIKGPDVLLAAFSLVQAQHPQSRLVYVGDGSLRESLRAAALRMGLGERVLFAGMRSDIPAVMAALDIFAMPSRSEGLPFALLEAMAASLPLVTTSVGHIPDLITDGQNGLLVPPSPDLAETSGGALADGPPENPGGEAAGPDGVREAVLGMARGLEVLLASPEKRARFAANTLAVVRERYSQERMFAAYEALYTRFLSGKKERASGEKSPAACS